MRGAGLVPLLLLATACAGRSTFRSVVSTAGAPAAIGAYSQAVVVGDTAWVSGQLGLDPATGRLVEGGVAAETRRALENLRAILAAAGFALEDVVQVQVFLADLEEFALMNEAYARFFGEEPPARATVQVARLPRDARVEVIAVARRGRAGTR